MIERIRFWIGTAIMAIGAVFVLIGFGIVWLASLVGDLDYEVSVED